MPNLQHDIVTQIKDGDLTMRPRWHFGLRAALWFMGVVVALLAMVYLLSFVFFFLRQSGLDLVPGLGFRGISFFVLSSPWLLVGASAVFMTLLYLLVSRYAFSYERPLLYTMLGVVSVAFVGSWMIQQTMVHERISTYLEARPVPVASTLYRGALAERPTGLFVGVVQEVTADGLLLETERGTSLTVQFTADTRFHRGVAPTTGTRVVVFGEPTGDGLTAYGVRPDPGDRLRRWRDTGEQRGAVIRSQLPRPSERPRLQP